MVCVLVPGGANENNGRNRRMRVKDEEIHHAALCQQFIM
jgi:hypothetical protein